MRLSGPRAILGVLFLVLACPLARADQQRFDIQSFRPTVGPRDLIIAAQSQPLAAGSFAVGSFFSFSLDPLVLLNPSGDRVLDVVSNRVELDFMAAVGLWNWVELGAVMPVILFQQSGNLEALGTEGSIRASGVGDISLFAKVPVLKRLPYAGGFGAALSLRVNAPIPGAQDIFAGDGSVTFNPTVIVDYRFLMGALIAAQVGVHFRPDQKFFDVQLGPVFTANIGGELPIVRRWGLTSVGGVYANAQLTGWDNYKKVPAEAMLGLRWYSDFGVTFTTGFNFGIDCGFGIPTFRFFLGAVWVPWKTKEYEAIKYFKKPPEDPDGDGVIGDQDHCPDEPGPVENHGCPERDTDKDGIPDQFDRCPLLPGPKIYGGCPRVYVSSNKINVLEKVHFATDQDVILPESFSVLEEVAETIRSHPQWQEILVEGHCDFRASDAYNLDLSQRRAQSVMRFLINHGVEPSRLRAQGFGRSRPIADNRTEEGMALNRRVEFTILRTARPAPPAPQGQPRGGN